MDFYLSLPKDIRYHPGNKKCEKFLFRHAFHVMDPNLVPQEILWRKKEAFSDGVSGFKRSWYTIIEEKIEKLCNTDKQLEHVLISNLEFSDEKFKINPPKTLEQSYYRSLYKTHYANFEHLIPYFWMPSFVNATDASARTLNIYNNLKSK